LAEARARAASTKAARHAAGDPRLSLEERHRGVDDYVQRVRASAMALIRSRYLLAEDLDSIVERAKKHWTFAIHEEDRRSLDRR
jgi:alpha/beta hydrolase family protein